MQSLFRSSLTLEIDGGTKVGVGDSGEVEVDRVKVTKIEIAKVESQTAN